VKGETMKDLEKNLPLRPTSQGLAKPNSTGKVTALMSGESAKKAPRSYSRHGLTVLKQAVRGLGGRVIDRRTSLGKALAQWRADLVGDLGGKDCISTQQHAVIELAVRTKLLLDSIDSWLLTQPALIDKRKRALLPAVRERQALADALARYMTALGLERRAKPVLDLHAYLATKYADGQPEPDPLPTFNGAGPHPHDTTPVDESGGPEARQREMSAGTEETSDDIHESQPLTPTYLKR
jgi:hypothetical protein